MDEVIKNRIRKISALASGGIDGEKANAENILDKLLRKYDFDINDILDDKQRTSYEFGYKTKREYELLIHVYLKWVDAVNEGRDKEYVPIWSWDSGFKLDFDGALFSIRSRFYPPKTHYGNTWDGSVGVCFQGTELCKREFDCKTLDELKDEVENYVKKVGENIKKILIDYFSENNA